ncbi:YaaA family protein [Erysipelothrix enhydrae]|uniref:YaaA family protein n=1 Tax=Erysipelothrix enhydrae TaxID=2890314 RepID=UPI002B24517B|nr:YaaA family protein [Erysipelothrix sp. 4322-04]WRB87486.1 YaaA family protein [Erysipelothrix sp. 4322-04]
MIILVSPTKTQKENSQDNLENSLFPEIKSELLASLQSFTRDEIKKSMRVSDKIADTVYHNYQNFSETTPAILSYQGSSFKNMNRELWSHDDYQEAQKRLYIFSALYGLSKCSSAVGRYRFDFLMKLNIDPYQIWKQPITDYLNELNQPIVNLASGEYSSMIDVNTLSVPMITLDFKEQSDDSYKTKSTYVKIARGKMVSYLIQNRIQTFNDIKNISFDGYTFNKTLSTDKSYIFTRKES